MSEKTYDYVEFESSDKWRINLNRIIDVEPDLLDKDVDVNFNSTVWSWAFTEDIFQASSENNILDVGWYPDGDPNGGYRLVLVEKFNGGRPDWDSPKICLHTRSTEKIIREIKGIIRV